MSKKEFLIVAAFVLLISAMIVILVAFLVRHSQVESNAFRIAGEVIQMSPTLSKEVGLANPAACAGAPVLANAARCRDYNKTLTAIASMIYAEGTRERWTHADLFGHPTPQYVQLVEHLYQVNRPTH